MEIIIIRKKLIRLINMSIISTSLTVRGQPSPRFHVELGYLSGTVKWISTDEGKSSCKTT